MFQIKLYWNMICWRCHSNSVNTGSSLPNISDVMTRKRRNMIGIDMIRNNRIVLKYYLHIYLIPTVISRPIHSLSVELRYPWNHWWSFLQVFCILPYQFLGTVLTRNKINQKGTYIFLPTEMDFTIIKSK